MKTRGQDGVMHYQLGNVYNLCPQAVSVYQLIVKSRAINCILNVEIISGVGADWNMNLTTAWYKSQVNSLSVMMLQDASWSTKKQPHLKWTGLVESGGIQLHTALLPFRLMLEFVTASCYSTAKQSQPFIKWFWAKDITFLTANDIAFQNKIKQIQIKSAN